MPTWIVTFGAWLWTLAKGFLPTSGQKTGKILWVGGIALLVMLATNFLQKPHEEKNTFTGVTTINRGEEPNVKYSTFGCTAGHVRTVLQWKW